MNKATEFYKELERAWNRLWRFPFCGQSVDEPLHAVERVRVWFTKAKDPMITSVRQSNEFREAFWSHSEFREQALKREEFQRVMAPGFGFHLALEMALRDHREQNILALTGTEARNRVWEDVVFYLPNAPFENPWQWLEEFEKEQGLTLREDANIIDFWLRQQEIRMGLDSDPSESLRNALLRKTLNCFVLSIPEEEEAENERKEVSRLVHTRLAEIKEEHYLLWKHLEKYLKIGEYLSYEPDEPIEWET